jgi:3-keto-5-aminohexanoate cleavage enzyme
MSGKMIIEARINEYAMRDENPNVPWTAEEIAETAARCWDAGATIVHFHARAADGAPLHGAAAYREIIEKVRARCPILIHPTLGFFSNASDPRSRIETITTLAADSRTRPDFAPIDTGSVNLEMYDAANRRFLEAERMYINRTDVLEHYARELDRVGVKPVVVTWGIGFTRRAAAMMEIGLLGEPTFFLLNMTDGAYITGHPGTVAGLDAHLAFLPAGRRVEWASNIVGGDLLALGRATAERGGHLAVGIGDYAYAGLGAPPNEAIVERAVQIARETGREVASLAETRAILGLAET